VCTWKVSTSFEKFSPLTFLTSKYKVQLPVCADCVTHAAPRTEKTGRFTAKLSYNDANRKKSCRALPLMNQTVAYANEKQISFRNQDFAYEFARLNNFKFES
jgi:hypothetical protein